MARFLLIHGAAHGAWCWRDLLPLLAAAGHEAAAIDLPSHGADRTPVGDVTLDLYADAILAAIGTVLPAPVILVGHSMAGYPITLAAERAPEKIAKLVYLCAYLPAPGRTLTDRRREAPYQPLLPAIRLAPDRLSWTADPAMAGDVFYQDCPPGTLDYALPRLTPQAVRPTETVVDLTGASASLPRHYIRCEKDGTIPPEFQVTMTADWPEGSVSTLPTGHSPFFSAPAMLAQLLQEIAQP